MTKVFTILKLLIVVVLIVILLTEIFMSVIAPNNVLFKLKRSQEKIIMQLKSEPNEKAAYMSYLLDIRLQEVIDMFNEGDYRYILPASLRYSTAAGELTALVNEYNLSEEKDLLKKKFKNPGPATSILSK